MTASGTAVLPDRPKLARRGDCERVPRTTTATRLTDPPPSAQVLALLARPDIAALADQIRALTARQRAALAEAFQANYRLHSLQQIRICHRVSRADPANFPHHAAVRALIWRTAAAPPDGDHAAAAAASDMAFVLLSGPLLDPPERALFTAPWRTARRGPADAHPRAPCAAVRFAAPAYYPGGSVTR
jgi:hypothetical protein